MSVDERTLRARAAAARLAPLDRIATALLERALAGPRGGALEVRAARRLARRFGTRRGGRACGSTTARFFRRLATRGKLGLGESYTAGEWDADDLVALFELLLRNATPARERHPRLRAAPATRARA